MYSRIKIEIKNLNKTFKDNRVLKNIDLDVRSEEALVIIGGSGSGKSVLIKCISGLLTPDPGAMVIIDHEDLTYKHISKRNTFTEKFGMLFQGGALFDSLPIWQNVAFGLLRSGKVDKVAAKEIAIQKLDAVELQKSVADLYPSEISGGMQKRVAIARAIATEPQILFFDEPTSGLDPLTGKAIIQLIRNLSKQLHATTITITHDLACMYNVPDKVAVLRNGAIISHCDVNEIKNTKDSYIKEFISQ